MNKILSKEGKIRIRGAKVLDTSARACCCQTTTPSIYAFSMFECCSGDEMIWVSADLQEPCLYRNGSAPDYNSCTVVQYAQQCFSLRAGETEWVEKSELDKRGIPYITRFDDGEGFTNREGGCSAARFYGQCPICPDACCNEMPIPNCDGSRTFDTCVLGSKYRITYRLRKTERRFGMMYRQSRWIYDIPNPSPDPLAPPLTKCFGLYQDDAFYRSEEFEGTFIIEKKPDDPFTQCFEFPKVESATLKRRLSFRYAAEIRFRNTLIDDGVDTGLLTSTSVPYEVNPSTYLQEEEFVYREGEIDGVPWFDYFPFRGGPLWVCQNQTYTYPPGTPGRDTLDPCCYYTFRDIYGNDSLIVDIQESTRNNIDCLEGTSYNVFSETRRECISDLDREPTLPHTYEREFFTSWNIQILDNEYCEVPLDPGGRIPRGDAMPASAGRITSEASIPRNAQAAISRGCHKCQSSIGL